MILKAMRHEIYWAHLHFYKDEPMSFNMTYTDAIPQETFTFLFQDCTSSNLNLLLFPYRDPDRQEVQEE